MRKSKSNIVLKQEHNLLINVISNYVFHLFKRLFYQIKFILNTNMIKKI